MKDKPETYLMLGAGVLAVAAGVASAARSEVLHDALVARATKVPSAAARHAAVRTAIKADSPEASNGDTDLMSDQEAALVIKRALSPDRTTRTTVVVPRLKL